MQKRNICFFNSSKSWGGGEKFNHDFALLSRDKGYNVFVVTNPGSELAERIRSAADITLVETSISNTSFLNPFKLLELKSFFRKNNIDTVIMALPSDMKSGGIAARMAGVPRIIYRRGIAVPVKNTALNRYLFRNVITKLICNTEATRQCVLANNPDLLPRDRQVILNNGFDVNAYDALDHTPLFERTNDKIIIGNAARLTEQKGQMLLLDVAEILRDRGLKFRIFIAGKGELEDELQAAIATRNLRQFVELKGFVEAQDIARFNASIDIFAMPSLWEGFGYSLVEAMAHEKPVVAFDVSSMPEVVTDKETGFLVPEKDTQAFTDKLEFLMNNPSIRAEMGNKGRQRVLDNFEMSKIFSDFESIISS